MAIYHLDAKIISRGKGQSAIAAAAYRSGERLFDEDAQEVKFYRTRSERIVFTEILAPKDVPEWAHDRNRLWNDAEQAEPRRDSQLAREFEISLPHELTEQQREWLIKDYAREAFVRRGYVVDIAIHAPDKTSDDRNHHAHLMVTMRTLGPEGFNLLKDRSLNTDAQLLAWREHWADLANRHLERHGHSERIDHRSLKKQGLDREPGIHLGYAAAQMAARGARSDRMDELRGILDRNEIRLDIKKIQAELKALENEQEKEAERAARGADVRRAERLAMEKIAELRPEQIKPQVEIDIAHAAAEADRKAREAIAAEIEARKAEPPKSIEPAKPKLPSPAEAVKGAAKVGRTGLHVADKATGAVMSLGNFILDFLAGPSGQPTNEVSQKFTTDPRLRKEQAVSRARAAQEKQTAEKALESMREDLQAGRNLKAEDIRHLTRQHQEQIRNFGDSAVQQMVDEARKRSENYWKGDERERER